METVAGSRRESMRNWSTQRALDKDCTTVQKRARTDMGYTFPPTPLGINWSSSKLNAVSADAPLGILWRSLSSAHLYRREHDFKETSRFRCIRHVIPDSCRSTHNRFKSVRTKALHIHVHVDDVLWPGSFSTCVPSFGCCPQDNQHRSRA